MGNEKFSKKHSIKLTSIKCDGSSEPGITDGDEVYLVCQADAGLAIRFPEGINEGYNMESGSTWSLNNDEGLILNFDYEVLVTLWDHDLNYDPNVATYLQSVDFEPGTGSSYIHLKNPNGADYKVYYEYLN